MRRFLASLALVAAVVLVHAPVLELGFVDLDDPGYVTANREVREGLSAGGVRFAFTTFRMANWHPLTWLSHMLDVELFGLDPTGHHATSLALHALTVVLVLLALERASGRLIESALAAALFALHPLRVETVAWVAERKELLAAASGAAALLAHVQWARRGSRAAYVASVALLGLGLLAKPTLVTLPFVMLLLDAWPLGRAGERGLAGLVREKLPHLALVVASSVVTLAAQGEGGAVAAFERVSFSARAANAVVAYAHYLRDTFWPRELAFFYGHPAATGGGWSPAAIAGAVLVLGLVTALTWRLRRTRPHLAMGWLWFLGMLVPTIGLVQVGGQARADRYTHLPSLGLAVAVAFELGFLARALPRWRPAVAAVAVVVLACLATATRAQIPVWRSSETLARHALAVGEGGWAAHMLLARALRDRGAFEEALVHAEEAARIAPGLATARYNLGNVLAALGRPERAAEEYRAALALDPASGAAAFNLGNALFELERLDEAAAAYEQALPHLPSSPDVRTNLGNALLLQGRVREAIRRYEEALRLDPEHEGAARNLAAARELLAREEGGG